MRWPRQPLSQYPTGLKVREPQFPLCVASPAGIRDRGSTERTPGSQAVPSRLSSRPEFQKHPRILTIKSPFWFPLARKGLVIGNQKPCLIVFKNKHSAKAQGPKDGQPPMSSEVRICRKVEEKRLCLEPTMKDSHSQQLGFTSHVSKLSITSSNTFET